MKKITYDHTSIEVLKEIEHIQQNASMYIGATDRATHLLTEAFDNAIDEAKAGHATVVAVIAKTKEKHYAVMDNGRGIPIANDTIKTVASKLFSGGKFKKGEGKAYGIASGRHGIGIVAITALSDFMEIEVYRSEEQQCAIYRWEHSELIEEDIHPYASEPPFSTQITFKPSKKYFDSLDIDFDYIRRRMKIASIHVPNLKLVLKIDGHREIINCDLNEYFEQDILQKETKGLTKIFDLKAKNKDEELLIRWCYATEGSATPRQHGCVNLLSVDQGTHINRTFDVFRDTFQTLAKKEKLTFGKQDSLVGLRCFTSLMMYDPAYASQNKEKLSTDKSKMEHLYSQIEKQLNDLLEQDEALKLQLLSFFDTYRKRLDSSKTIIKTGTSVTRLNSVIGSKLKDCTTHNVADSELYIVEGDSAAGTLVQARDPKIHAILGLKGKSIPNVASSGKDLLGNDEVTNIINACGTGFDHDFDYTGLRYGKIIFSVDADADGAHISTLLMVLFLKLLSPLIEHGNIYLADMPLYGGILQKKFTPLYTEQEKDDFIKKNPKVQITRYKGLGEMSPDELAICLLDKNTRRLKSVTLPKDKEKIYKLMIDPALKRLLV
jgi:DNA gyrase/topoisomerase IV subunit B